MKTLTTKQLLEAAGFRSVRTLQRWRDRNLVPPPSLQKHPNAARGMTWVWPVWTAAHIRSIKERIAAGESLDDVARTLSRNWKTHEKKWLRKKPDFAAMIANSERAHATDEYCDEIENAVYDFLHSVGIERPGRRIGEQFSKALSTPVFRDELLRIVREGSNPVVLLLENGEFQVIPDFLLPSVVQNSRSLPTLVLPVRAAVLKAFRRIEPALPQEQTFSPALRVAERKQEKVRIRKYRRRGRWSYEIER